jgi:gamma-glutamylaminecyclotransferase
VLVFVYGTLRTGLRNHAWMAGARLLGLDETVTLFRLVNCGRFPAVLDEPRTTVVGEVWEVTQAGLFHLDILEQVPQLYIRREVELRSGRRAWIYLLMGKPAEHDLVPVDIRSGDYLDVISWKSAP